MGGSPELVVVSNRGPSRIVGKRRVRAAGGLVAALDPVLRARGGVWVSAQATDYPQVVPVEEPHLPYELVDVHLPPRAQQDFYGAVSNAVLWPLLHSMAPTIRLHAAPFEAYQQANAAFAAATIAASRSRGTRFWIHDYHLMLVPERVRTLRRTARIGWFCHVPWPSPDLFRTLPWARQLLCGLLGADVLGFHTHGYAQNFLRCIEEILELEVDHASESVRVDGRRVRVLTAPIGVAFDDLQTLAASPPVAARAQRLREAVGRAIVLGVDRLDHTKGIPERILAFERLLESERRARNRYVLVQVMVPSREAVRAYEELKNEIDRLVGDINGRFSTTGLIPIHYFYRNLELPDLVAHYRAADVALVTPRRDGMNLVAHEYAAARVDGDGVLVLSELA
ncbi:MAG: trehalose-6-phosphate synthase, partial [Sandaracinaceae bacterium]|nr:trehalose-6-phosphate synthase [Sandaracinaceae bacterium]